MEQRTVEKKIVGLKRKRGIKCYSGERKKGEENIERENKQDGQESEEVSN